MHNQRSQNALLNPRASYTSLSGSTPVTRSDNLNYHTVLTQRLNSIIASSPVRRVHMLSLMARVKVRMRGVLALRDVSKSLKLFGTSVVPSNASEVLMPDSTLVGSPGCSLIHPDSSFKQGWNLIVLVLLFYVFLLTPWILAFEDVQIGSGLFIVETAVDVLFLLDILITLNSSYFEGDVLITKRLTIFCNYLKGLLLIDIVAIFPFYLLEGASGMQSNSLIRVVRITKVTRVLRASKLTKVIKQLLSFEWMEKFIKIIQTYSAVTRLLSAGFVILLMAHFTACMWYFTARLDGLGPDTWVVRLGFADSSNGRLYLASLYWAFTILTTVGYGDIAAYTPSEMLLCIIWMLFGIGFYSFLVGTVASVLGSLDTKKLILQQKLDEIERFADEFEVPEDLKKEMLQEANQKSLHEEFDLQRRSTFLDKFSKEVKYSACMAMYNNAPEKVAFLQQQDAVFINKLVPRLIYEEAKPMGDVYAKGDSADCMYFLPTGRIAYVCGSNRTVFKIIVEGGYFGEIELIENTRRAFTVVAMRRCELLLLSRADFFSLCMYFPNIQEELAEFAKERKKRNRVAMAEVLDLLEITQFTRDCTVQELAGSRPVNQRRKTEAALRPSRRSYHALTPQNQSTYTVKESFSRRAGSSYQPSEEQRDRPEKESSIEGWLDLVKARLAQVTMLFEEHELGKATNSPI